MKYSPRLIGLIQAAGLAAYVVLFATSVQSIGKWLSAANVQTNPILEMTLALLAFVTSALICSSIVFGYPLSLFLKDKRDEALRVVKWTLTWLIIVAASIGIIGLCIASR